MKCFPVTFILMLVVESLLAAAMSGINFYTHGHEVEENLIISRRKAITEHEHKTDSGYGGILTTEEEMEELNNLDPHEVKPHMQRILESMDENKNGYIEKNELATRLLQTYKRLSIEEADSEFETGDLNKDGFITWKEYIVDTYGSPDDLFEEDTKEEEELFIASDIDKDGQLSKTEFRYFYTPEDYPHMKPFIVNGIMNRFDTNKDGQITFNEFVGDRMVGQSENDIQEEKEKFIQLDINKNLILDEDEMHMWASPNNVKQSIEESNLEFEKSDLDDDGFVTWREYTGVGEVYCSSFNHDFSDDADTREEKAYFIASDIDKDGQLNKIEFQYFSRPEIYPHMKPTIVYCLMNIYDTNEDGQITSDEFIAGGLQGHYDEEEIQGVDTNKNRILFDKDEMHMTWTSSNDVIMIAESGAEHFISLSDKNKDGLLSYEEILNMTLTSTDAEGYIKFREEL